MRGTGKNLISQERCFQNSRSAPIFVLKKEGTFSAVLMLCTHKECEVSPFGKELHCPCHGSEYDINGGVLEGPAEASLKSFKVSSDNDTIHVHLT